MKWETLPGLQSVSLKRLSSATISWSNGSMNEPGNCRRANEQLEGVAKEKDAFLANVSHELRTPLTAVSGFLQLLGRRKALGDKEKNYVNKALSASSHLETLIDDILDFQKIIMGGLTLDPSDFDAGKLLSELSDALQFQAKRNNNQLEFTWTRRVGTIHTDRQRLRQVLTQSGVQRLQVHTQWRCEY